MILSDNETKIDLLNYEAIAKTIVELLRERPEHPVTIGVHGDWGAGKSSVLEMVEAGLEHEDKVLCLKFNGWRFQGFEDAKIALIEGIVMGLLDKRPMLRKGTDAIKNIFERIDWLKLAKKVVPLAVRAGSVAIGAHGHIPIPGGLELVGETVMGFLPGNTSEKGSPESSKEQGGILRSDSETGRVPKEIQEFRTAFDNLLIAADIEQLIVLIDDLDRCLPETAIETLEAVRLFVFTARTAFIVAADEAMIEYSVRKHFPDLPDTTGPQTYSRNYLEKLIQVPFRIPALGDIETRIYVTLLLVGTKLGADDPAFTSLIATARERLKRPWTSAPLDATAIKAAIGEKSGAIQNELLLSEQIGPTLASGTSGNPRQIKRFLNAMMLRQRMAQARGFGDEVKLPVLAKFMLAERFLPRFFDQIAAAVASSPDGRCADLAVLEELSVDAKPIGAPEAQTTGTNPPTPSRPLVSEWLATAAIRSWATVNPTIGNFDLRPYLFVAKDRKDYFGAATVLGHLASVAESLLGPKLAVQVLEPSLRKLASPEAAQVLDVIRGRIISGDTFDKQPSGVDGLGVLVRAQPTLQSALLDFLESLPISRLGPWVCSGWEGIIKDTGPRQRFDSLLERFAKEGAQMLKVAAKATLKTRQKVQ